MYVEVRMYDALLRTVVSCRAVPGVVGVLIGMELLVLAYYGVLMIGTQLEK